MFVNVYIIHVKLSQMYYYNSSLSNVVIVSTNVREIRG